VKLRQFFLATIFILGLTAFTLQFIPENLKKLDERTLEFSQEKTSTPRPQPTNPPGPCCTPPPATPIPVTPTFTPTPSVPNNVQPNCGLYPTYGQPVHVYDQPFSSGKPDKPDLKFQWYPIVKLPLQAADKTFWYSIQIDDNQTGWIAADFNVHVFPAGCGNNLPPACEATQIQDARQLPSYVVQAYHYDCEIIEVLTRNLAAGDVIANDVPNLDQLVTCPDVLVWLIYYLINTSSNDRPKIVELLASDDPCTAIRDFLTTHHVPTPTPSPTPSPTSTVTPEEVILTPSDTPTNTPTNTPTPSFTPTWTPIPPTATFHEGYQTPTEPAGTPTATTTSIIHPTYTPTPLVSPTPTDTPFIATPTPTATEFPLPVPPLEQTDPVGVLVQTNGANIPTLKVIIPAGPKTLSAQLSGEVYYPRLSPYGDHVVYLQNTEDGLMLRYMNVKSGNVAPLLKSTPDLSIQPDPIAWIPNSKILLVHILGQNGKKSGLYCVNVDEALKDLDYLVNKEPCLENASNPTIYQGYGINQAPLMGYIVDGRVWTAKFVMPESSDGEVRFQDNDPNPIIESQCKHVTSIAFAVNEFSWLYYLCSDDQTAGVYLYVGDINQSQKLNIPVSDIRNIDSLPAEWISFDDGKAIYLADVSGDVTAEIKPTIYQSDGINNCYALSWSWGHISFID
jgi:hypothetical protein